MPLQSFGGKLELRPHGRAKLVNEIAESPGSARIWTSVDRLLARAADVDAIRAHGLGPVAAKRYRRSGRPVPSELIHEERTADALALAAPWVLARIRQAFDGEFVLFKGPEVASLYTQNARAFGDLDVLTTDAGTMRRALMAFGFHEIEDPNGLYVDLHHLVPLQWHDLPLRIEIHSELKWPDGLQPPSAAELVGAAVPSRVAAGIWTLSPEHHALALAAHGWAHRPFRSLRDLLDVALVSDIGDAHAIEATARAWGMAKLWLSTRRAVEALFLGCPEPLSLKLWSRHLRRVRERMVLEAHLQEWVAGYWGLPIAVALRETCQAVIDDVRPAPDEDWGEKVARAGIALRHAFSPGSEHDRFLGPSAYRGQKRNRLVEPGPEERG